MRDYTETIRKIGVLLASLVFLSCCGRGSPEKALEFKGKEVISASPPFSISLPVEARLIESSSLEFPEHSSMTRTYLADHEAGGRVEHLFIVQIADKTDPQAEPMAVPPLRPDVPGGALESGTIKKNNTELQYLIQLITWNPDSPSLQAFRKKGPDIPAHPALQGQILFGYEGRHAVLLKYSRDVHSFGTGVSSDPAHWERQSMSGDEKEVYDAFAGDFHAMLDSLAVGKGSP